jgi:hypothetical protein
VRMLGHMGLYGCGSSKCPHCSEDGTTRRRKRIEQRAVRVIIEDEARAPVWFDEHDLAAIAAHEEDD